jgi:hypothetical protein
MPAWLVGVINACSSGASSPVAAELSDGLSTPPPFASSDAGVPSSSLASADAASEWVGEASVPAHLELLVRDAVRYAATAGPHRVRRNAPSIMVGAAQNLGSPTHAH